MRKQKTIVEVEKEIEFYELVLSCRNVPKSTWNDTISRYHALNIKLCQMKGESPIVAYHQPEHIV